MPPHLSEAFNCTYPTGCDGWPNGDLVRTTQRRPIVHKRICSTLITPAVEDLGVLVPPGLGWIITIRGAETKNPAGRPFWASNSLHCTAATSLELCNSQTVSRGARCDPCSCEVHLLSDEGVKTEVALYVLSRLSCSCRVPARVISSARHLLETSAKPPVEALPLQHP